jgi:hypothetical protein
MEITTREVTAIEQAIMKTADAKIQELSELELTMIGGGQGDISLG